MPKPRFAGAMSPEGTKPVIAYCFGSCEVGVDVLQHRRDRRIERAQARRGADGTAAKRPPAPRARAVPRRRCAVSAVVAVADGEAAALVSASFAVARAPGCAPRISFNCRIWSRFPRDRRRSRRTRPALRQRQREYAGCRGVSTWSFSPKVSLNVAVRKDGGSERLSGAKAGRGSSKGGRGERPSSAPSGTRADGDSSGDASPWAVRRRRRRTRRRARTPNQWKLRALPFERWNRSPKCVSSCCCACCMPSSSRAKRRDDARMHGDDARRL